MGIKLILTENQLRTLDEQLSQEMREGSANLSCTDINYHELDQYLGNKNDRKLDSKLLYIESMIMKLQLDITELTFLLLTPQTL